MKIQSYFQEIRQRLKKNEKIWSDNCWLRLTMNLIALVNIEKLVSKRNNYIGILMSYHNNNNIL